MSNQKKLIYEVTNLKKSFGDRTVLQVGHLLFHPGTIYGLIGPIGSGKSTLLKILAGKEKQDDGSLLYDDEAFEKSWLGKIKGNKDIFLADADLYNDQEKISAIVKRMFPDKAKKIEKTYFSKGIYSTFWSQTAQNMSPGEKAWFTMVLAVESDPRVLLIDDYGTIIDNSQEFTFRKKILEMNKNLGTTIIVASHSEHLIKRFASVLIYLDNGHVSKIRPGGNKAAPRRN